MRKWLSGIIFIALLKNGYATEKIILNELSDSNCTVFTMGNTGASNQIKTNNVRTLGQGGLLLCGNSVCVSIPQWPPTTYNSLRDGKYYQSDNVPSFSLNMDFIANDGIKSGESVRFAAAIYRINDCYCDSLGDVAGMDNHFVHGEWGLTWQRILNDTILPYKWYGQYPNPLCPSNICQPLPQSWWEPPYPIPEPFGYGGTCQSKEYLESQEFQGPLPKGSKYPYSRTFTYSDLGSQPGYFQIDLAFTDPDGHGYWCVGHDFILIANTVPECEFINQNNKAEGSSFHFDASGSHDADNDPLLFKWNFGDGTSQTGWISESTIDHVYAQDNSYNPTLVVKDDAGNESPPCDHWVTVLDTAPTPVCTWSPAEQTEGQAVTFYDQTADCHDGIQTTTWTWGDCTSESHPYPTSQVYHTFARDGTYTVKLKEKEFDRRPQSASAPSEPEVPYSIKINDIVPVPNFSNDGPKDYCQSVHFWDNTFSSSQSENPTYYDGIAQWSWDFDDTVDFDRDGNYTNDNDAQGSSVYHTFPRPGTYTVTLTVTEMDHRNDSCVPPDTSAPNVVSVQKQITVTGMQGQCDIRNPTEYEIFVDAGNTSGPWYGTKAHPYKTIQDGVNTAGSGMTVLVEPGVYNEHITIDKDRLTLKGDGHIYDVVIDGGGTGTMVTANSHSTISGFWIKDGAQGIYCGNNADYCVIEKNIITHCSCEGIELGGDTGNRCVGTQIINNTIADVKNSYPGGDDEGQGILARYAGDTGALTTIQNNIIMNCDCGIYGYDSENYTILAYNDVLGNNPDYRGCPTPVDSISINPVFSDSHYHLGTNSPCVDAGDPASAYHDYEDYATPSYGNAAPPARGTVRNDMGAYGGRYTVSSNPSCPSNAYRCEQCDCSTAPTVMCQACNNNCAVAEIKVDGTTELRLKAFMDDGLDLSGCQTMWVEYKASGFSDDTYKFEYSILGDFTDAVTIVGPTSETETDFVQVESDKPDLEVGWAEN